MAPPDRAMKTDNEPAIGIDLGTTVSAVASVDNQGQPISMSNQDGDLLTPTALFVDDGIVIGREAINGSVMEPDSYAECFKRDVGSPVFRRSVCGVEIPPEILSAFVLDQLRRDAERRLGPVKRAVITVPAFFDEARRKATQDAGRLAGLEVLDIINEPTAAALAYGHQHGLLDLDGSTDGETTRVLVYDLGGGTFDVTILEVSGTEYRTIATDGDVQLGGKDFDERLVDHLAETFIREHGTDPRSDPRDRAQLWLDAQRVKHTLSQRSKTSTVLFHAGERLNVEVTKPDFDQLTCDLLERTETTTSLVVREAGLTWDQIDRVLLVGGSSRMPAVSQMLQRVTGREVDRSLSPDEAVAHGAALRATMLTRNDQPGIAHCQLINVNSHSLGVRGIDHRTRRSTNGIMIPKNTPLPCQVAKQFTTIEENQRSVRVVVLEGESQSPEHCIELGECVIRDLPPGLPKGSKIEVIYRYDSDGRVAVSARIPQSRRSANVEIRRSNAVELEDLDSWKKRLLSNDSTTGGDQSSDPGSVLRRLDELHLRIGNAAVTGEVSEPISRPHRAALEAIAAMRTADTACKQAIAVKQTAEDRDNLIRVSAWISKSSETFERTRTLARFNCIVLGRECIKHEQVPPKVVKEANEVKRLRKQHPI